MAEGIIGGTVIDRGRQYQGTGETQFTSTYISMQGAPISLPPELAGLSSDMLLAYVRTNLTDLDKQVTDILHGLNGRREQTAALSQALTELRSLKSSAAGKHHDGEGDENDGYEFDAAARQQIEETLTTAGFTGDEASAMVEGFGGHASANDIQGVIDNVSDRIGDLNNQNEYDTMQVTDLLSKRSNLIQMVSKMMASMDEANRSVIQNIR